MKAATHLRGRALAVAALAHIEEYPELWDQGVFRSPGGKTCFLGRCALLAGYAWVDNGNEWSAMLWSGDGRREGLLGVARGVLSISEVAALFFSRGSLALEDLRRLVGEHVPEVTT